MTATLTGRCLCGAIRYRLGALRCPAVLCHCESCRRAAGAHAVAWLTVDTGDLVLTAGTPRTYASSPGVERAFCGTCGTPLTYRCAARPSEVDVTVASLEQPGAVAPADHIWMDDAVPWDRPGDGLPCHRRLRGAG